MATASWKGAEHPDCATLTRMVLSPTLPKNGGSRVLGIIARALRRATSLKFLITYADPSHGHAGTIYQAAGWLYTGLSQATPHYDFGGGVARHSRSLSQICGTRSAGYMRSQGVTLRRVPQRAKFRYVLFLDASWRSRLRVPVLPYPKGVASL